MTETCQCTGLVMYDELRGNVHVTHRDAEGQPLVRGCGRPVELPTREACERCGASLKPEPGEWLCTDCNTRRLLGVLRTIGARP